MPATKLSRFLAAALPPFLLVACGDSSPVEGGRDLNAAVPVVVESLRMDSARTRLEAVGTSRAMRSIEIFPATSGEVIGVHFHPGEKVNAGDVLVELERREEELAAALARVRLEDAERLFDRYQRSANSGAVLPTTVDEARTAVEAARIELERSQVALDFRTIRAPFEGYVGITDVDQGDRINSGTLITTLDDRSALLVRFEAPEALNGEIEVGDEVAIQSWNARENESTGIVEDIGSRIDPLTRTFAVRARVNNEDDRLRPGMSFRISMDVVGMPYQVIAETAVQWGADGAYVWSVAAGEARRIPVSIIQRQQGSVLIDTELDEGELVIVEGIQRMRSGVAISYDEPRVASSEDDNAAQAIPPDSD